MVSSKHTIPEAQVGVLKNVSVVSFAHSARNFYLTFTTPRPLPQLSILLPFLYLVNSIFTAAQYTPLILFCSLMFWAIVPFLFYSRHPSLYLRMAWGVSPKMNVVCLVRCTLLLVNITGCSTLGLVSSQSRAGKG